MARNSPFIQDGALQAETPRGRVPPLYLARGCKISISFATCARRPRRRRRRDLPRSSRETKRRSLPPSSMFASHRDYGSLCLSARPLLVLGGDGSGRMHLSFLCRRCELPRAKSCATCFTALRKERGDILHLRSREGGRDRRRAAAEEQGEKVLISARHPPRRWSVGRSDRVASFADRAPFFDHPQIPFAPSLTRLSKRFGDVMSAAASPSSPSFPSFPSLRGNYVRMARAQVPLFGDH